MTICNCNARTHASDAAIEDLVMQDRKLKRRGEKAVKLKKRSPGAIIDCLFALLVDFWEDTTMNNIDSENERLLIRQQGAARAADNHGLKSKIAILCREAIKEDLKEGRAEVLADAPEEEKNVSYAQRIFANPKKSTTALRNSDGTHSLLLGSLRQPRPLGWSPFEERCTCHTRGLLLKFDMLFYR
ncbi:hypothetical protein RB195_024303 [Necator americanus]|uniref:Uncharacterized protein n=1 Tax=Necator americanus TaxID=51031 RepID=A0ABR1EMQ5_NECAM